MYKVDLMPLCENRCGKKMGRVQGVVIHYVAADGGRAAAVRSNFIKWAEQVPVKYASAHDIIDLNGDIYHIIPYDEMAWHVGAKQYTEIGNYFCYPNGCLIGVELCHPDETAKPTEETRAAAVALCRDLCVQFNLNPMVDIYLHNDITGKWCHKYYCEQPEEWLNFRSDVQGAVYAG